MTTFNKYQVGWLGLRLSRVGNARKHLKRCGWWPSNHAAINNRNGFDYVKPGATEQQFLELNLDCLARIGAEGMAFWISDAQWGKNCAMTDLQWRNRRIIKSR